MSHAETQRFTFSRPLPTRMIPSFVMLRPDGHDHIVDERISIGCLSSHKLSTLNAIMPTSSGH